jgi:glucose/arabinose dehydrogenase
MRRAPTVLLLAVLCAASACSSDDGGRTPAASEAPSAGPASSTASPGAAKPPAVKAPRLDKVVEAQAPVYLTAPAGDDRLFVVEQAGRVIIVDGGRALPEPFLDISADVRSGGEQGLLSMAFSPSYADDGLIYVNYTDLQGDTRVVEFERESAERVDPASRRELIKIDQPYANHNGGLVLFDPTGMLLIGMGDGGAGGDPDNRAQNLGDLLGKLLRIDPKSSGGGPYGIPKDNPFVDQQGARPEIWAFGLRNPWRFSFDAAGTLYMADVGQNAVEEVDVVGADRIVGANFGWSAFEGDRSFERGRLVSPDGRGPVRPALTYSHDGGRCSITGGGVYAGSVAALRGRYLYADYCSGEIWSAPVDGLGLGKPERLPLDGGSVSSFGVDSAGEMYVVTLAGGVYRIDD